MRKCVSIGLLIVLLALSAGCSREPRLSARLPFLTLTLQIPEPAMVKATVPATDAENAIHDLKIWVFNASTRALITSLEVNAGEPSDNLPQAGSVKRYSLPVSWDFALTEPRPKVDVYVLANSASIGLDSGASALWAAKTDSHEVSSWEAVNGAFFTGFSPSEKVMGVDAEKGLPMSGLSRNMTISGEEPSLSITTIPLERCVSKIRFLFSQVKLETDDPAEKETFRVDKIELGGETIPTQEFVFAAEAPNVGASYIATVSEFPGIASVNVSEVPELYAYAGEDGPSYEQKIADALADNKISIAGTYYLRESDKALSGTITYTVTKGAGTASESSRQVRKPFSMPAGAQFPRNYTWTVYGYYVTNRTLQLSVSVLPWDKSDYDIEFSTASLMVTHKLAVLDYSVESIDRIGTTDEYNVTLKRNRPASAYLNVVTPKGGKLQLVVNGDQDAFDVWFTDENNRNARETTIDPDSYNGLINISIDRNSSYSGVTTGKSVTLSFTATTPDGEREIEGASECIDQIFNFILP